MASGYTTEAAGGVLVVLAEVQQRVEQLEEARTLMENRDRLDREILRLERG